MRVYNIYYKHERINKTPLTKDDVNKIKTQKIIHKAGPHNTVEEIPVDRIRFVGCVVF